MNTELTKMQMFMIITVLAGLLLAVLASLLPVKTEADFRVSTTCTQAEEWVCPTEISLDFRSDSRMKEFLGHNKGVEFLAI